MRHDYNFCNVISLLLVASVAGFSQGVPSPIPVQQFFSNNGTPLALGSVCTYLSGGTTPSAVFRDYTLTTPWPSCVPLDSAGRASTGMWLNPSTVYRFRLLDSLGVVVWTVDGVTSGGSGSSGSAPFFNATAISGPSYEVQGTTIVDSLRNATFATLTCTGSPCGSGGGGGGSAGLPLNSVQFNTGPGTLTGSVNFLWDNTLRTLTVSGIASTPTIAAGNGYIQADGGFLATSSTATSYNSIQAPGGGVAAKSFTAANYIQTGSSAGTPSLTGPTCTGPGVPAGCDTFHAGAQYWDTSTSKQMVYNGTAWVQLAGSGVPANPSTSIQFNSSGAFGGSANLTWTDGSRLLAVTGTSASAVAITTTGFVSSVGGLRSNGSNFDQIQLTSAGVASGGVNARSLTASKYVQTGFSAGVPSVTTGDTFFAGAMYWDTGSVSEQVFNGSSWVSLGSGTGVPGGTTTNIQFNSAGGFGGSADFKWNDATGAGGKLLTITGQGATFPALSIATGYSQSDGGFLATASTAKNYNVIQAPGGGMSALSFTAVNYIQSGTSNGVPALTGPACTGPGTPAGCDTFQPGAMYWDIGGTPALKVYNGSSWSSLSGGAPGGVSTNVQYNGGSGALAGSNNFTWNNGSRLLTISAAGSTSAGIAVSSGYIQTDAGFFSQSCVQYNCFQSINGGGALTGGMAAASFTAAKYMQSGTSSGIPTVTPGDVFHAGAHYWDTGLGAFRIFDGVNWNSVTSGTGITSLNGLTGAVSIAGTANQITVTPAGSTITLNTPQAIGTTSNVTFGNLTVGNSGTAGVIQAFGAANTTAVFQVNQIGNGTPFQVDGLGDISGRMLNIASTAVIDASRNGLFNSLSVNGTVVVNTSLGAQFSLLTVTGAATAATFSSPGYFTTSVGQVINSSGSFVGPSLSTGTGAFTSAVTMNGGFTTGSATNSTLYVGTGSLYNRTFSGGDASCGGVTNGWIGVRTDTNELQVCIGGVVKKVSLL